MNEFLQNRRSTKLKHMTSPAPTDGELNEILKTAARIPDHGKLAPFYFITFEGEERAHFGNHLRKIWANDYPHATQEQLEHEQNRFMRAPLVIAVISRIRDSKIPAWEQILTTGAVCYNLCLACNTQGYGTNWLTEWYAFHPEVHRLLNLENNRDNIAGFIYIGTQTEAQDDRERPDIAQVMNRWSDDQPAWNKGDLYNKDGMPRPIAGFKIHDNK